MTSASRAWRLADRKPPTHPRSLRASVPSLRARYRRSAVGRAHRIASAPSRGNGSPASSRPTPAAHPWRHAPTTRDGRPPPSQSRSIPPRQDIPCTLHTSTSPSSAGSAGRAIGARGRQSCVRATSPVASTSSPSTTQPDAHTPTSSQGQTHPPPATFSGDPQGCGRCASTDTSSRPTVQRARPSEQSVPPRSGRRDPPGPPPPRPGDSVPGAPVVRPWSPSSTPRRVTHPRSHAGSAVAEASASANARRAVTARCRESPRCSSTRRGSRA